MSPTRGGLEPAVIVNKDTGETVRCMFNPHEYTLTKQNRWERGETKGKNVPRLKFSQGGSQTLKLQLFFEKKIYHNTPRQILFVRVLCLRKNRLSFFPSIFLEISKQNQKQSSLGN